MFWMCPQGGPFSCCVLMRHILDWLTDPPLTALQSLPRTGTNTAPQPPPLLSEMYLSSQRYNTYNWTKRASSQGAGLYILKVKKCRLEYWKWCMGKRKNRKYSEVKEWNGAGMGKRVMEDGGSLCRCRLAFLSALSANIFHFHHTILAVSRWVPFRRQMCGHTHSRTHARTHTQTHTYTSSFSLDLQR